MSALGSLVVNLALEYAEYTKGLSKSDQESLRFAQNAQRHFDNAASSSKEFFVGVVKGAAAAGAAYLGVSSAIGALNSSIDDLANLDDLSQKTGSTVENLSRLQKVAVAFHQDFGLVDVSLSRLAKGMAGADEESSKVGRALEALGVSAIDAAGNLRDPSEVMVDVAKKLQNYQDGAAKTALVNDLLGKSGAELLPYLNDLAENVDRFSGVSTDAARKASEFQDKMGLMRVRAQELFTSVAIDLLPTFTDFIDALNDTKVASDNLTGDSELTSWADDVAIGFARIIDVAKVIPSMLRAVGGSFEAVGADVEFMMEALKKGNPVNVIYQALNGGSANEDLKKALEKRNKTVEEANKRYSDLWNTPANQMEQAVLARMNRRRPDGSVAAFMALDATAGGGAGESRQTLNYTGGGGAQNDFDKLISSIREKIALDERQLALGRPLTDSEKDLAKIESDRATRKIKLTDAEMAGLRVEIERQAVLDRVLKSRVEQEKMDKERLDAAQKEISTAFQAVEKLQQEVDTYGMLPSAISAATVAKLEALKVSLEMSGEALPEEIAKVNALIEANKRLGALQGKKEDLDKNKKDLEEAAKDAQKILDNLRENIQRNLGDELFNMLDGNFENIGDSFKRMLMRMVADATAADIMSAIGLGKGGGGLGSLIGGFFGGGGYTGAAGADGAGSVAEFMAMDAMASFDGGGFTGDGSRSGGLDGKGGFLAMMHPRETVVDHSRGQSAGKQVTVHYAPTFNVDSRTDRAELMRDLQRMQKATIAEMEDRIERAS